MNDVQIVWRRFEDLTDRSVIRWGGQWREVMQVYRTAEDLRAEWADGEGKLPHEVRTWSRDSMSMDKLSDRAFDRVGTDYVIIRLYDNGQSKDEVLDWWVICYRLELVECQSLPAFTTGITTPQSLDPHAEDEELARHPRLVAEYCTLRQLLIVSDMTVPRHAEWRFADGKLTHGTIEYESDNGRFRIRLQELDDEGAPKGGESDARPAAADS